MFPLPMDYLCLPKINLLRVCVLATIFQFQLPKAKYVHYVQLLFITFLGDVTHKCMLVMQQQTSKVFSKILNQVQAFQTSINI